MGIVAISHDSPEDVLSSRIHSSFMFNDVCGVEAASMKEDQQGLERVRVTNLEARIGWI